MTCVPGATISPCVLEQGELDRFCDLLGQVPKSADTEPEIWMFRGIAREKAGDWQAASELFQKAIDLDPTKPKYYYRLAMAEERLGLRKQAIAHRERTKEMNEARGTIVGGVYAITSPPRRRGTPARPTWRPPASISPRFATSWAGPVPPKLGIDWRSGLEVNLCCIRSLPILELRFADGCVVNPELGNGRGRQGRSRLKRRIEQAPCRILGRDADGWGCSRLRRP